MSFQSNSQDSLGSFGGCALHRHAKAKDWHTLVRDAYRKKEDLKKRDEFLDTPFHLAVRGGAPPEILMELLEMEPQVLRLKNVDGLLPLHIGCEFGLSLRTLVAFLKLAPETKDWVSNQNKTPLQIAQSAKIFIIGTPTWHIFPEDYSKVVAALEQPHLLDALYKAQVVTGTTLANLDRAMIAKARSEGVFMAVPINPPPGY